MFSRFPKWLFRAFLAFVALELFYLLAVTIALNTGLVERIANRKPEKFQVHWDWAWSPWPGRTYLGGVETKGQTKKFQWYASADSVSTTNRILPLFKKTVHLTGARVKGVDYRQRRRLIPGAPPDPAAAEDPPIPGYSNPPDPPPESLYPKKIPKPPWTILIDRVEAQLMQIWVDRYRITGGAECETAMNLVVREHLELPMVKLHSSTAELWVGDEPRFQSVKLDIDVKVYPFVPKGTKGLEVLRKISGRISIKTPDSGFAFVESHFRKVPWVEIDGRGPLLMTLNLDRGKFLPGTSFEIDRDHIDVKFLDRHLVGNGFIDGEISLEKGIPRSRVTVVMDEFHMTQVGESEPYLNGEDFRVVATSRSLDIQDLFSTLEITLDLAESEVPDLSFYNIFIPEKSGLEIVSGVGKISYHFAGSHEERSIHGELDLRMENLVAKFQGADLMGDITISTKLREGNPQERRFDISGTRLDFRSDQFDWTASIAFPQSRLSFTTPMEIDAEVDIAMTDTRPLVVLFDAMRDLSNMKERLMTIKDIQGRATLRIGKDAVDLTDLDITGEKLHTLADFRIAEGGRDGILYIKFHGFGIGLKMTEEGKDLKFWRPRSWFDKQRKIRLEESAARGGGKARENIPEGE